MHRHSIEANPNQPAKRRGIVVRILEALHFSRRREAQRTIRHYRHFIVEDAGAEAPLESARVEESSRNAHGNDTLARAIRRARQNFRN